jgi:hypothetical protein
VQVTVVASCCGVALLVMVMVMAMAMAIVMLSIITAASITRMRREGIPSHLRGEVWQALLGR